MTPVGRSLVGEEGLGDGKWDKARLKPNQHFSTTLKHYTIAQATTISTYGSTHPI